MNDFVRDTAVLLADVAAFIQRFIVLRDEYQAAALALYVLHTHALGASDTTPYLAVLSAEKRSGKSRLLELLARLCARAELISGASEAALFQLVEARQPTLLIDEIDAVFAQAAERTEALRKAINFGNRRAGSIIRGGKDGKHVKYATFCPKVLAGIENGAHVARRRTGLPDTVRDRSNPILLRRKPPGVKVERLLWRDVSGDAQRVHDGCVAWGTEHEQALAVSRPQLPDRLDDRAAEGWEPLLAIADLAGGCWAKRAREAALALAGDFADEGESLGVRLLTDLRTIFTADLMSSADVLAALNRLDESAWGAWHDGKGITARELARLLQRYGVSSSTVRIGNSTPKGYKRQDLVDPWTRYLPAVDGKEAPHLPHPPQASNRAARGVAKRAAATTGENTRDHGNVADVADVVYVPGYVDNRRSGWR